MFQDVAKIFNRGNTKVREFTTKQVVIEALCAQRDKLILSEDLDNLEVAAKLALIKTAIDEVLAIQ